MAISNDFSIISDDDDNRALVISNEGQSTLVQRNVSVISEVNIISESPGSKQREGYKQVGYHRLLRHCTSA